MEYDAENIARAQAHIREVGYSPFSTGGTRYAQQAAQELSNGCPGAQIEYLFAGDDLFIDIERWPNPIQMQTKWQLLVETAARSELATLLSPADFDIIAAKAK